MKKFLLFMFCFLLVLYSTAFSKPGNLPQDTLEVKKLYKLGFDMRLKNPEQTVIYANNALNLAKKINYKSGAGESLRIMGIGNFYLNLPVKAINNYLAALDCFQEIKDIKGQGRVYNNIGVLYRENNFSLALEFFQKSLAIAQKSSDNKLMAPIYLNIGIVYFREKSYNQALLYYNKSNDLYVALKDSVNLIQCMQDRGLTYFNLNQYEKAENFLLKAKEAAKHSDLNITVASTDLTIAELYIAQKRFLDAEKIIKEGITFSNFVKNDKLLADYKYTSYQLEFKRKNYKRALYYLQGVYTQDSTAQLQSSSTQITVFRQQVKQQARQKENEFILKLLVQRQQYDLVKFCGMAIVASLLLVLVGVLISNVRRKAKTNAQLIHLNGEISRQKENLDRINHHLEEIIDERTKDLQIKNKTLSEYSSYLSHQIRGPIATLKGLLNLEREGLIGEKECVKMMNKSVSAIDEKILEMSDMLHDPKRPGF